MTVAALQLPKVIKDNDGEIVTALKGKRKQEKLVPQ